MRSLVPKIEEFTLCATQVVKPKQQCQIFKLAEKWVYNLWKKSRWGMEIKYIFQVYAICTLNKLTP